MKTPIIVAVVVTVAGLSGCGSKSAGTTTATTGGATPTTMDAAPAPGTMAGDPDAPAPSTTVTPSPAPAARCSIGGQAWDAEEALIALAATQLDQVKAARNFPADAKRILVARYQQMIDDARARQDAYAREDCPR